METIVNVLCNFIDHFTIEIIALRVQDYPDKMCIR